MRAGYIVNGVSQTDYFPISCLLYSSDLQKQIKGISCLHLHPLPPPHPLTVILLPSPPPLPSFYSLFLNLSLLVFPSLSFSRLLYQLHEHLNKLPECPLFIKLIFIKETVCGISSYISFRDGNARIIFTTRGTLGTFKGSVR